LCRAAVLYPIVSVYHEVETIEEQRLVLIGMHLSYSQHMNALYERNKCTTTISGKWS